MFRYEEDVVRKNGNINVEVLNGILLSERDVGETQVQCYEK